MKTIHRTLFLMLLVISPLTMAQDTKENLSQQAANPLADLMSFPFQNNLNMNYGELNSRMDPKFRERESDEPFWSGYGPIKSVK